MRNIMRVAITSMEKNLESKISPLFGKSNLFIIVNLKNQDIKDIYSLENPAKNKTGCGNIAAQFIVDQNVNALISGRLGPVAFHILKNAGIKIYKNVPGNVNKNLKRFKEGLLEEITSLSDGFPV